MQQSPSPQPAIAQATILAFLGSLTGRQFKTMTNARGNVFFMVIAAMEDAIRAYPSQEYMDGVKEIDALADVPQDMIELGDFDGDGVKALAVAIQRQP